MSVDSLQHVESYIRDLAKEKNCRFSENFLDYDKLRLGYVTAGQFFRVIRQLIGVALDPKAEELIRKEYGINNDDIDWRKFVSNIEGKFDVNDFTVPPECKILSTIDPGNVDYMTFEKDIKNIAAAEQLAKTGINVGNTREQCTGIPEPYENYLRPSLHMIMDRIKFAVHRRGIRVMEFFTDYDKLRHDAVTEHQFVCALLLAIGKEAQLTRPEVQMIANYYRKNDNPDLISYREFCRQVDSPFLVLNLEKDPLKQPSWPAPGMLSRGLAKLDEDEEQKVSEVLDKIRSQVEKRRILTFPYFRDFDLGTGCTQLITAAQFARVLHFLGMQISAEDCRRLCRKFADPTSGEVSYRTFCKAVDCWYDPDRPSQDKSDENEDPNAEEPRPAIGETKAGQPISRCDWMSVNEPKLKSAGDDWPVDVLLDRIRHLVLTNRIPLKPWFHDFDQLRSGQMTRTQFARCLTAAGLTRLDLHDLTPSQMSMLTIAYASKKDPNMVNWTKFVEDVDSELETKPLVRVLPQETFVQPKPGTADWSTVPDEMREHYERSMAILRRKILERRMLLLPDFEAFDKYNRGYVSSTNFRQLVTMFNFSLSPAEIDAIVARHSNDEGFDYRGFLHALDPPPKSEDIYQYPKRLEELRKTNIFRSECKEIEPVLRDTEGALEKLKSEVSNKL
ncbi:unnamed protein product [Echinostoma caproni]|uniref:EF-hand domain-containing protein n=1 Tax=Echinostoma caproni TaxID=27848 RepID=A0A183B1B5_9TREM|nr:unnamed protein product [Echinostoma caproni]